jgi:hypothetical protein
MKRKIRLTEGRLRDVITEAVMMVLNEAGVGTPVSAPALAAVQNPYGLTAPSQETNRTYNTSGPVTSLNSFNPNEMGGGAGNLPNITVTARANPNKRRMQVPGMQQPAINQNLRASTPTNQNFGATTPMNQNFGVNVPTNQNANILLNNTLQLGQRLGQQQLANQIYTAMRSNDKRTLSSIVNRYSRSCPQLAQQANAFLQLNVYG